MSNLDDSPTRRSRSWPRRRPTARLRLGSCPELLTDPSHHRLARELETIATLSRALDLGAADVEKLVVPAAPAPSPAYAA